MREIVMDTETTGFDADKDDRIVEIGGIELLNHLPTGRTFHVYINPERPMPKDAFEVHGLGDDFLRDKPKFAEIAQGFLDFIGDDARLVQPLGRLIQDQKLRVVQQGAGQQDTLELPA